MHGFEIREAAEWLRPSRAWLRRLAPAGAHVGIELGSREGAEVSARLNLLAALSDTQIMWLTNYWTLLRTENKLIQYRAASALDIAVPPTAVASDAGDFGDALGDPLVLKPLGVGEFTVADVPYAVHTRSVRRGDAVLAGLSEAPFLAQRRIDAAAHLRVVTVGDKTWCASLNAGDLPLDWREDARAHREWQAISLPEVEVDARRLAEALGLGYSSQDWIVDDDGVAWFVDGNPAGQWLFLPAEIAEAVTQSIAAWLAGSRSLDPA